MNYVLIFLLHIVLTFIVQRILLKIEGDWARMHPHGLMILLIFLPPIGLGASLIVLIITLLGKVNFKNVYKIK